MRGGFNKKHNVNNSNRFNFPRTLRDNDCCPCVFYYIGLINENEFVQLSDHFPNDMTSYNILYL